jgi:hypothetical protein
VDGRGEYDGRIVRWWAAFMAGHQKAPAQPAGMSGPPDWGGESSSQRYNDAVGPLDRDVIRLLAGPVTAPPRLLAWEGTRYRLDLPWAETNRLAKLLGEHARPYLSSAHALVQIALSERGLTRDTLQQQAALADRVLQAVPWPAADKPIAALRRAAAEADAREPQRFTSIASALRLIADDLFARGLTEMVYAIALGQPDRLVISAGDGADRHDFGLRLFGRLGAWRPPVAGSDRLRDWHATGSLLGLDVRLAEFALVRHSSRPPPVRPTLNDADRRVLVEAVALIESAALTDADRDTIVGAMRRGRTRLAGLRTRADAATLADEIRLSGARRSLLSWAVAHDPERAARFLSPSELLWLGLETRPIDPGLHVWGAPSEARVGCVCLQLPERRPFETLAGRWESGILASGFPDLNLRLAELLSDLQMPAPLLAPVLASATADLITLTVSRGPDDRRGLEEFVHALQAESVELYLALLTTDGPLVPIGDATEPAAAGAVAKTEVAR